MPVMRSHVNIAVLRIFVFLMVLLYSVFPNRVGAVGVSPGYQSIENVANGILIDRTITITRDHTDKTETYGVVADGEGATYLEFVSKTVTLEAGKDKGVFHFVLHPQTASMGEHTASLAFFIVADPGKQGSTGSVVKIGVAAKVHFIVTDKKIEEFLISDAAIQDTEVKQPLIVEYKIKNNGNVDVQLDKMILSYEDMTDPSNKGTLEIGSEKLPLIKPGVSQTISVDSQKTLQSGRYKGKVSFVYKGKTVNENESVFSILPEGTLEQNATISSFTADPTSTAPNDLVQLVAKMMNSGKVGVEGTLYIEIKKDDKIVDILKSDKKLVGKGTESEFTQTFRPSSEGDYITSAYFDYGSKKTDKLSATISVHNQAIVSKATVIKVASSTAGVSIVGGAGFFFIRRKKHEGKKNVIHRKKTKTKK